MRYIAHRGNLDGPNPDKENSPEYILKAISLDYDVEVDIWFVDNKLFLGHDQPQYEINQSFLINFYQFLWCHAKNIDALDFLLDLESLNCFWHQKDDVTLTSKGYIWTYPGKQITTSSIIVLPEKCNYTDSNFYRAAGICSDYINKFKERQKRDIFTK